MLRGQRAGRRSTCASRRSLRFGRTRTDIGVDLNNLLNTNYATGYNTTYIYGTDNTPRPSGWGTPTSIYNAAVRAPELHGELLSTKLTKGF